MGKTKYYAIRIKFKERVSLHVRSFIWIFNAQNTENGGAYIAFMEKTINPQLPKHLNDPELLKLVKTSQVHANSRTCWKYNKNIAFPMVNILLIIFFLQNHLILNLAMNKSKRF